MYNLMQKPQLHFDFFAAYSSLYLSILILWKE
jgi:hypothetical protein